MENRVRHLGIIMDGNRRWAKVHALASAFDGHRTGGYRMIDTCEWCEDLGIDYLTVYAFSTENWTRSQEEVEGLFRLMEKLFVEQIDRCVEKDVKVLITGNLSMLSERSLQTVEKVKSMTAHCKRLTLNIALSYGGRDEIVRGVQSCVRDVIDGKMSVDDITEKSFGAHLDSAGLPDMDLVIRTGGQHRLSNFFPWLTVYSEMFFTDVLWPDFSKELLIEALDYYASVQINNGK
ncbi:MAG: polyprenyl diphosphate synthase [Clostridia bacterium]|nr:polyprenyl diphosphate synthase [Clostridia bacterium]